MEQKPGTISADYKVKGGKLLRVRLNVDAGMIRTVRITGDFFMHPEDALETLEHSLIGIPFQEITIRAQVQQFFNSEVQVIGAEVEDFVHVLLIAS
ncbi:MAG: biotin--protein ligase [Anaerolineae bacterium]|nr:biotin--protein ligase [Anaerolineae bacterium]